MTATESLFGCGADKHADRPATVHIGGEARARCLVTVGDVGGQRGGRVQTATIRGFGRSGAGI